MSICIMKDSIVYLLRIVDNKDYHDKDRDIDLISNVNCKDIMWNSDI